MERFYPHIDSVVEKEKPVASAPQSELETMPQPERKEDSIPENSEGKKSEMKKRSNPYMILKPIDPIHVLRIETRETDLPESPKETVDVPMIPDRKKAEEDYNSIDYQIIAFNLWKAKAKELF